MISHKTFWDSKNKQQCKSLLCKNGMRYNLRVKALQWRESINPWPQHNTNVVVGVVRRQYWCNKWQQHYKGWKYKKRPVVLKTMYLTCLKWWQWMPSSSHCFKHQLSWSFTQANSSHLEPLLPNSNELGVSQNVSFFPLWTTQLYYTTCSLSLKANSGWVCGHSGNACS